MVMGLQCMIPSVTVSGVNLKIRNDFNIPFCLFEFFYRGVLNLLCTCKHICIILSVPRSCLHLLSEFLIFAGLVSVK